MSGYGEPDVSDAVALLVLEDAAHARERGAPIAATILGSSTRAPSSRWPTATEISETMSVALRSSGLAPSGLAALILDPHRNARDAQLAAIDSLCIPGITLIDLAPVYGNCLAASAPLTLHVAIAAARRGSWPDTTVLRGSVAFQPGRPVLILACGLLAGCASLLVMPYGV
jgi:minimal PKS chain-length factor (CLF/KS beta)